MSYWTVIVTAVIYLLSNLHLPFFTLIFNVT